MISSTRTEAATRFQHDIREHVMQVKLDNGVYRHLHFRRPTSFAYAFDIVTWPGYLAITGDMGAAVFTRLHDMFQFFRAAEAWQQENQDRLYINPSYWAEKCTANDGDIKAADRGRLEQLVRERYDEAVAEADPDAPGFEEAKEALWAALQEDVIDGEETTVEGAIAVLDNFNFRTHLRNPSSSPGAPFADFQFHDAWEDAERLTDYTFHFLWRLYAIAYAVKTYDAAKAQASAAATPTEAAA